MPIIGGKYAGGEATRNTADPSILSLVEEIGPTAPTCRVAWSTDLSVCSVPLLDDLE